MTKQFLTTLVAGAICAGLGCTNSEPLSPFTVDRPVFQQAPADGNGNKDIFTIDEQFPDFTTCAGGATLNLHLVGWIQARNVSQVPQAILPFHFDFIYSNTAGETYVWRQTGSQHFYFNENGDLMLSIAGRLGYDGNIGRLLVNITTGTVEVVRGKGVFAEDLACAALT